MVEEFNDDLVSFKVTGNLGDNEDNAITARPIRIIY
jgi:hypothetical protein